MVLAQPCRCARRDPGPHMPIPVVRLSRLYSHPAIPAKPATEKRKAQSARPARTGILGVAKSAFYDTFVLKDPADQYIPGSPVRRLPVFPLGKKAMAASEKEVARIIRELARFHQTKLALKPAAPAET